MSAPEALRERLRLAWVDQIAAQDRTTEAVRALREAGASWDQVAEVVHYSAEGARRRWAPLIGQVEDA